jgi:ATP-dependent helicase HrpA
VVVESPTGSGKTTQLPVILHEAGYSAEGMIGVPRPRRIAAVSVGRVHRGPAGSLRTRHGRYKMRFDDRTTPETIIKVMTDGILLQEIKNDEYLRDYSVIMVDEAHERSLNIDFVLGLLKRALELRSDLRVIISSATINADIFSQYFELLPRRPDRDADVSGTGDLRRSESSGACRRPRQPLRAIGGAIGADGTGDSARGRRANSRTTRSSIAR